MPLNNDINNSPSPFLIVDETPRFVTPRELTTTSIVTSITQERIGNKRKADIQLIPHSVKRLDSKVTLPKYLMTIPIVKPYKLVTTTCVNHPFTNYVYVRHGNSEAQDFEIFEMQRGVFFDTLRNFRKKIYRCKHLREFNHVSNWFLEFQIKQEVRRLYLAENAHDLMINALKPHVFIIYSPLNPLMVNNIQTFQLFSVMQSLNTKKSLWKAMENLDFPKEFSSEIAVNCLANGTHFDSANQVVYSLLASYHSIEDQEYHLNLSRQLFSSLSTSEKGKLMRIIANLDCEHSNAVRQFIFSLFFPNQETNAENFLSTQAILELEKAHVTSIIMQLDLSSPELVNYLEWLCHIEVRLIKISQGEEVMLPRYYYAYDPNPIFPSNRLYLNPIQQLESGFCAFSSIAGILESTPVSINDITYAIDLKNNENLPIVISNPENQSEVKPFAVLTVGLNPDPHAQIPVWSAAACQLETEFLWQFPQFQLHI